MSDLVLTYKGYPRDADTEFQLEVLRFIHKYYPDRAKYQGATDHMSLTYRSKRFLSHCSDMGLADKYICRALPAMVAPGRVTDQLFDIRRELKDREDWAGALRGLDEVCETWSVKYRRYKKWVELTIDDVGKDMPGKPIHSIVWAFYNRMAELQRGLAPDYSSPEVLRTFLVIALSKHPLTCEVSVFSTVTPGDTKDTKDPSYTFIQAACDLLRSSATSKERHQEQHN